MMSTKVDVTIVGGGMITNDLILPSIYHLQRTGMVGTIDICARHTTPLQALIDNEEISQAFPGQSFVPHPALDELSTTRQPDLYRSVISAMDPRQAVIVAVPDDLHYDVVKHALHCDQHVLCVKPFVMTYREAEELEQIALEKGLFIGIEYHKRFDRRSLLARRHHEQGDFGAFVMGEAKMIEPYFYRSSNFQNWFTCDKTDPFVYVGCHYVDLVQFITGLKPVAISVVGVKGTFPNGNEGYMWANGRVIYENGAVLSVIDGLGYPDEGAGSNEQCLTMYFEGDGKTGMLKHNDQFRGVSHSYLTGAGCCGSTFNYVNPDFYRLVPWEGEGYKPDGYGYESVAATISMIHRIETAVADLGDDDALARRRAFISETDAKGLIATPANSKTNELVVEAARASILDGGREYRIAYTTPPTITRA
jgi:predicted dehydrogenase